MYQFGLTTFSFNYLKFTWFFLYGFSKWKVICFFFYIQIDLKIKILDFGSQFKNL